MVTVDELPPCADASVAVDPPLEHAVAINARALASVRVPRRRVIVSDM
jgi:hypothetical protein